MLQVNEESFCDLRFEELPVTFQVAMVGSDGWVLASDERATRGIRRSTYQTSKIRFDDGVATAAFDDECAQIARDRIIDELRPDSAKMREAEYHRKLEKLAERIWLSEYKQQSHLPKGRRLSPERVRGIIFMSVGNREIAVLEIGKQSHLECIRDKYVYGTGNLICFMVERYYDKDYSVDQLALLATHSVVQAAKFNIGVSGLQALLWRQGEESVHWLNEGDYRAKSEALEREMLRAVKSAMGPARSAGD